MSWGGFIIRTAAENVSLEELKQDEDFLKRLWRKVLERKVRSTARQCFTPSRHWHNALFVILSGMTIDSIRIDSKLIFLEVKGIY